MIPLCVSVAKVLQQKEKTVKFLCKEVHFLSTENRPVVFNKGRFCRLKKIESVCLQKKG